MKLKRSVCLALALLLCLSVLPSCAEKTATYTAVSTQSKALMEIKSGTADAAVIDYTMAKAMTGEGTDYSDLKMIDNLTLVDEEYGIGFRNGSNLVSKVNEAISALVKDGTLAAIAENYGLTGSLLSDVVPSDEAAQSTDDDWAYVQGNGKLIIGITEYAPMNYYDDNGKLVGFDTEFAQAVCEYLGIEPEFVIINWDTKETELQSKIIDCIWNGLTVSDERKANMDFSASYLNNKQVIVVKEKNADKYTDIDSLSKASFVAEQGSAGETAIYDAFGLGGE
ncbi:MAG: transporter substrate-binding domain-containing protein [Oscillospiraceae bacterium]